MGEKRKKFSNSTHEATLLGEASAERRLGGDWSMKQLANFSGRASDSHSSRTVAEAPTDPRQASRGGEQEESYNTCAFHGKGTGVLADEGMKCLAALLVLGP